MLRFAPMLPNILDLLTSLGRHVLLHNELRFAALGDVLCGLMILQLFQHFDLQLVAGG